jgi:uncharacterized protein YyaL (SSP411 family)
MAAQLELYPSKELVVTSASGEAPEQLRDEIGATFAPNRTILVKTPENEKQLERIAPFTKNYPITAGKTLYYVCEKNTCSAPIEDFEALKARLSESAANAKR